MRRYLTRVVTSDSDELHYSHIDTCAAELSDRGWTTTSDDGTRLVMVSPEGREATLTDLR